MHSFAISTSKSGPRMVCFVHCKVEACFVPQPHALFDTSTSESSPRMVCVVQFWLGNVLRTTPACTFATSQLPKVLRSRQFLTLLTSKYVSRHNSMQLFIWPNGSAPTALTSLLFNPPEPHVVGKTVFRDCPTFSAAWISFFWLPLLWSFLLLFSSLLFSASPHPWFSSVHIVGSLTSKLPWMRI